MGRNDVSLAELLERATANGYKQGAHQEEDSKRDNTKYVKKTLRDQDIALKRYEKWVVAVEKKEQDTGKALFGDDAAVDVSYTIEARSLRKGLPPLDLATIKDFLRFIIATSRGIIDDGQKQVTVDSMNTFAEWFFAGFARVMGNRIDEEDRHAVYDEFRDQRRPELDHFLALSNVVNYGWSNVLVVGELKANPNEDGHLETLVQLAGYAREVFGGQPSRRFTHAYTLCGSQMRLYLFDKSGAYSSPKFDIHTHPERFVKALAGYVLMSNEELGLNTFIKRDGIGLYILSHQAKIYLEDKPIASQNGIVCRGTTCYRGKRKSATDWECVVKFSWPSAKRRREGDLLKLAKARGVKGIAKWIDHQDIVIAGCQDTIANLRSGLKFTRLRQNSIRSAWVDGATSEKSWSRSGPTGRSSGKLKKSTSLSRGLGINTISVARSSSSRKRKRDQENESSQSKRSRSSEAASEGEQSQDKVTKRDEVEAEKTPYSNLQEPQPDSLMAHEDEVYDDRAHCCLVVSPAGRPIDDFQSIQEFLGALCDAIQAHKSLWIDGRILHRDISENNIVIAKTANTSAGILIDLDLAKEQGSSRSGARHRTGTMQFMAIEVLDGISHTYRHDLESFFYVFLWICIRHRHRKGEAEEEHDLPSASQRSGKSIKDSVKTSILREWYTGTYKKIANAKRGYMDKGGFKNVLAEFSPYFETLKPLAEKLRGILFPRSADGELFTGTPPASDCVQMYDRMIYAFNEAIENCETG